MYHTHILKNGKRNLSFLWTSKKTRTYVSAVKKEKSWAAHNGELQGAQGKLAGGIMKKLRTTSIWGTTIRTWILWPEEKVTEEKYDGSPYTLSVPEKVKRE